VSAVGEEVREGTRVRVIDDLHGEQDNDPLNAGFVDEMVEMAGLEFTVDSIEGRNIHFNDLWWSRHWFEVLSDEGREAPSVATPEQFSAGTRIVNISGDRWSTGGAVAVVDRVEYSTGADPRQDRIYIVGGLWNYRGDVELAAAPAALPIAPQPVLSTYERVQAEVDRVVSEAVEGLNSYRVVIPGSGISASRRPGTPFTLGSRTITRLNGRNSVEVQVTIIRNERHEATV
jgi:hypothetical protein